MGHKSIRGDLVAYLEKHIGATIHRDEIAEALNITAEQVTNAMGNFRRQDEQAARSMQIIAAGRSWVWRGYTSGANGSRKGSHPLAEEVWQFAHATKAGDLILEDTQGRIYRAVEL